MKKTIFLIALFFCFSTPFSVDALGLQGFGGFVPSLPVPCTCSGMLWIPFAPLYPQPLLPPFGALTYMPGTTILKPWFRIGVPLTWELGQFTPGLQLCYIGAPPACVILPSNGHMFLVGTS